MRRSSFRLVAAAAAIALAVTTLHKTQTQSLLTLLLPVVLV